MFTFGVPLMMTFSSYNRQGKFVLPSSYHEIFDRIHILSNWIGKQENALLAKSKQF
ncbi:hypothetical protein ES703_82850 [subsurface metagenome]